MMKSQWKIREQAPVEFGEKFPEFSKITKELLWQRELRTQKEIDEFFNPDYSLDLHDPLLLKNAKKAITRIFRALKKRERVITYGDYDADGVCGATILYNTLQIIGFPKDNLGVYLPDREKEGYGLNNGAIEQFIKEKYDLIITVDCGTTSHEQIDLAKQNGIDTIVLDHHRVIDRPPDAHAFVNPHQEDDKYPFKDLAGAAVAFKIACALFENTRNLGRSGLPRIEEGQEKWFLDLVALATVTDVMPLLGENRALVKYGLFVLAQAKRLGLCTLMEISGIKPSFHQDTLSTNLNPFSLGFLLGPRLNAAGRMDHANTAFALLNAQSYEEALDLARQIDVKNRERQKLVQDILMQIEERMTAKAGPGPAQRKQQKQGQSLLLHDIIFEGDKDWPIGVLGIVAGRLAEKYYRPSFIYELHGSDPCKHSGQSCVACTVARGSVRTIPGFNVVHALESVKDLLINFGGHPQAGGFTVSADKLEEMKRRIEDFAKENLEEEDYVKKVEYSCEVSPEDISWQVYEELERFEPFGEANREPVFLLRNANIVNMEKVGKDNGNGKQHLRFFLNVESKNLKAMGFRMGDKFEEIKVGDNIDALFSFAIDEWNGNRELMLRLVDFRKIQYTR